MLYFFLVFTPFGSWLWWNRLFFLPPLSSFFFFFLILCFKTTDRKAVFCYDLTDEPGMLGWVALSEITDHFQCCIMGAPTPLTWKKKLQELAWWRPSRSSTPLTHIHSKESVVKMNCAASGGGTFAFKVHREVKLIEHGFLSCAVWLSIIVNWWCW